MEAHPNFQVGATPPLTTNFLLRIENLKPTDPSLSEDDTGASWGHYQFTSGSMTIKSVIQSWDCVGSTMMACKLIAAAVKTCKVARHICFEQNIKTTSFLADAYLSNLINELYDVWVKAGGVGFFIHSVYFSANDRTKAMLTQSRTTVTPMDIDQDPLAVQTPPPSPPLPSSSPIAGSSVCLAPSLEGERAILGSGGGMRGSAMTGGATSTGGNTIAGDATAKGSTAGIKFTKPKGGLHVSVSPP
jgi:hypothetical protein